MCNVETRLRRLERILEFSRELTSTVSLEPLLHKIVEAAAELTDSEAAANYISNAIKYGGRPGERVLPRIELGFDELTKKVRFWVRDNGPGLTPEEQSRLFTPFTRLDQARAKGHGLGLSIVQRIVEKMDGQTGVESAPGQGSVFFFTLPDAPA
ncbi:MAG: ATP-binding protein [Chloroflexota bacterium]|nr:ATP-binding protein [Chloroflexota bacterium]